MDQQNTSVKQQLKRVVESNAFAQAPQLRKFLTYIVEETLAGREKQISQYSLAIDVFGRDAGFDSAVDAVVRVEAGRLRTKLRDYYFVEGVGDQVVIELAKGRYAASFAFPGDDAPSSLTGTEVNRSRIRNAGEPSAQPSTARNSPTVAPLQNLSADPDQDYLADGLYEDPLTDLSPNRPSAGIPEDRSTQTAPAYLLILGALIVAAATVWILRMPGTERTIQPETQINDVATLQPRARAGPAIAILPFENMSADPEQEYFSDGITEDIITDLSIVSGLTVIARHSTFVYKNQSVSIRDVGEDLGVDYILEGSVRKAGERIRVTAQLIDVATESHIWANRYDRNLKDVFDIQDEVSHEIVSALEIALTDLEEERLGHSGTTNIEAHDLYLRGQEQFYRFDAAGVSRSIELFSTSIERDPTYAKAYAWKSRALVYSFISGLNPSKETTVDPALELAKNAIELDDFLPMGHANLAWALRWDKQIEQSINAVERAIELDPNFAEAYLWQSIIMSVVHQGDAALAAIQKANRLNPNFGVTSIFALGRVYFALGDMETAIQHFDRGIERKPNFLPNYTYKVFALELTGDVQAAEKARSELEQIYPSYELSASYRYYYLEGH